jgi:pyruvate dehydrogenase E2 component (dihydrolipoamide acetyltransferase)
MAFEFKLPDIGEGVVEGEIVKWLIKPGDAVTEDQPMVEVMTDKATVVIPSPRAGKVLETRGAEGSIAKVGGVLVVIEEAAKAADPNAPTIRPTPAAAPAPAAAKAPPPPARPAAPAAPAVAPTPPPAPAAPAPAAPAPAAPAPAAAPRASGPVLAAPATRRLARELGVDMGTIGGTGPAGRVTSEDVRRAAAVPAAAPVTGHDDARDTVAPPARVPVGDAAVEERIAIRGLRKRIFDNMARSKSHAAHFTFVEECDCTALVALRDRFNAQLKDGEAKLQYLPFIVKAVIAALKQFPDLNGHVDEAAMEFVRRRDYHIGIAASTDRGLIVPVARNADRRSLLDLSNEIKRLGDTARAGRLGAEDLGGSTFTITSLGKEGGIFATPIINYPEVAIMGVHKMVKRPMVNEDDDTVVIKPMMNLSLSFDHRLVDGHIGAAFTYAVIKLLQNPDRLLMEMA